jgi:hypothetical protein
MKTLLLLLFFQFLHEIKIITLPFEVKLNNLIITEVLLSDLYNINFYTKIKTGSNKQEMKITLKLFRFLSY